MTVFYDKSKNKYKAEVWFNNKKFKSKGGFRTKGLAEKWERETLNEIDQIKATGIQFKELTYNEIFAAWRSDAGTRKRPRSLEKDDQMHRDFISPEIGELKVKEISAIELNSIIVGALGKELAKSMVNKVIQHFKAVFNYAYIADLIPRNPSKSIQELKFQEQEMDFYYQEELDDFLAHAHQKYHGAKRIMFAFYLCLFTTGLRLGEALGLLWESIDFDRNTIVVKRSFDSSKKILEEITKGKKLRVIPLPLVLKNELINIRNSRKWKHGDFIFSFNAAHPFDTSNFRKRNWSLDAEEAGVRRIRPHDARHTYGAHFMMNGGDIYKLQKLLGHESITTTERYAHLAPNYLEGVRDMVQVNFGPRADIVEIKSSPLLNHSRQEDSGSEEAISV